MKLDNGSLVESGDEGLLFLTVVDTQSRIESRGYFCQYLMNWHSANLLCQSMGFMFADWGSAPRNEEYVAEYVSDYFY